MKLYASDVSKAVQGKTKSVTVRPTNIGVNILTDIAYILYNAFIKAKKEIPSDANYVTYGRCTFTVNYEKGSETLDVTTSK